MEIPTGFFDKYYEACNLFLDNDNIGKNCTLYYTPKKTVCNNCTTSWFGGVSTNVYKHGGPAPFSGKCPLCGGNGYSEVEETDTVRLRVYWQKKNWVKIENLQYPNADAMIIGYSSDLIKVRQAQEIKLYSDQTYMDGRFKLSCEPALHGFGKNAYFIAYIQRV